MDRLTSAERELVALGAALGSNCVPCIEYHVPEARKAGLSDGQIDEAIRLADRLRQAPAGKALAVALGLLPKAGAGVRAEQRAFDCLPAGSGRQGREILLRLRWSLTVVPARFGPA